MSKKCGQARNALRVSVVDPSMTFDSSVLLESACWLTLIYGLDFWMNSLLISRIHCYLGSNENIGFASIGYYPDTTLEQGVKNVNRSFDVD